MSTGNLSTPKLRGIEALLLLRLPTLLAVLAVLGALVAAARLPGADEDLYRYIGYAWTRGDLPYRDAFENKPPGVFMVWALAWTFAGGAPFPARALGVLAAGGAAYLLARIGVALWRSPWGAVAGLLFAAAICAPYLAYPFADTETFGVFFAVAGLWLVWPNEERMLSSPHALAAGLLLGGAILFKPVFAAEAAAAAALVLLRRRPLLRRLKLVGVLGLAAAVPLAVSLGYFHTRGAADDFIAVAFGSLAKDTVQPVAHLKSMYAGQAKFLQPINVGLLALASAGVLLHLRTDRERTVLILVGWLLVAFGAIFARGYFYAHQFKQLLPALCLLSPGILVYLEGVDGGTEALRRPARLLAGLVLTLPMLFAVFALSEEPVMTAARFVRRKADVRSPASVSAAADADAAKPETAVPEASNRHFFGSPREAILALTKPNERIWCFPESTLYVDARRLSGIRCFSPNFLMIPDAQRETLAALRQGRAKAVLLNTVPQKRVPEAFVEEMTRVVERHYRYRGMADTWRVFEYPPARTLTRRSARHGSH